MVFQMGVGNEAAPNGRMRMATRRKPRSDRNHLIYQITCEPTQQTYIGVCIVRKSARVKSLKQRWNEHVRAANVAMKDWNMSKAIREHGSESFNKTVLEVVRGKASAYKREAELINLHRPGLNTKMKMKIVVD